MKRQDVLNKIQEIREKGYKVYVNHYRMVQTGYIPQEVPARNTEHMDYLPKGGRTEVLVRDDNGTVVARGEAHCCMLDNFNKHIGLSAAMGRLCKHYSL